MLDIKFIRENASEIKQAIKEKKINLDLDALLKLDEERRKLQTQIDETRKRRHEVADLVGREKDEVKKQELLKEGKRIKEKLTLDEVRLRGIGEQYLDLMIKVPTIPSPDTPKGKDEIENVETFRSKEPPTLNFTPKDHAHIATELDLIDFERGVKVSGYRGYYLKNEAVMIVMGLMIEALKCAIVKGFKPVIPPTLVREFALFGSGYFAGREYDPNTDEIYKIANDEKLSDGSVKKENKFLVGTAEPSILAYFADEILSEEDLPMKLCGFSQCYRSEIGSYGRDTKGLYRVHEFMKVELVGIAPADTEIANKLHNEMLETAKEIHEKLKIPYRILQMCTGDLSIGKYKQFDFEMWLPGSNRWAETGSASNFLDWQARRLNVRYRTKTGQIKNVFMLNATALPSPRPLIAILENYQEPDGSVRIPEVLVPYVGKEKIKLKTK